MKPDQLVSSMRQGGFRATRIRTALAEIFVRANTPLSASNILTRLAESGLEPNKTTVYRELEALQRAGILEAVDFGDGARRYEIRHNHHHHLVCLRCKTTVDVFLQRDLDEEEQRIAERHSFTIQRHALEFFGLCARCH